MNNTSEYKLLLDKIKKEFINEFENEKLINDSFSSANIVFCDNLYDYLINNNLILDVAKNYKDTLNTITGIYFSIPTVSYKNNKYNIDKVMRYVLISDFDINNKYSVASLVHELGHLVKSYSNEYTISKDLLINHSGFINKVYKLDNKLNSYLIKQEGVGFEEGLNTYLEETIMKRLGYKDYISLNYLGCNNIARDIINTFDLYDEIKIDQTNIYANHLRYYLSDNYDKLIELLDEIYLMDAELLFNLSKEDKEKKINNMLSFIDDRYFPIKNDIIKQLKKKER